MDVVRRPVRPVAVRYALPAAGAVLLAGLAVWSVPLLLHPPAPIPAIDRSAVVLDVVRRGPLVRSVHAAGQLVPDRVQVVAAATDGIVVELPVRAGGRVSAGDIIAVLRNPDLDAGVIDVRAQWDAANAELRSEREAGSARRLDAEGAWHTAVAEAKRSDEEAHADNALHAGGLIGDLVYRETLIKAEENHGIADIARRKIAVTAAQSDAAIASADAKVAQLAAQLEARRAQVETLVVRAGSPGVVQSVAVDRGQRILGGTEIARIARAQDLKAVLQVAEGDVRGILPGLPVTIDASGERTMHGRVARIAPAAQNGMIAVDVALDAVGAGIRSDQNIDGSIEISRVENALSIARPVNAADDSRLNLYRLTPDGRRAIRTAVRLGAGSLDRVEVAAGLKAGDSIIVSDTSADDAPQLRLGP